jgi:hypothetical protein
MSQRIDLVTLSGSELRNGVPVVSALSPATDGSSDVEPFGALDMASQLGVYALPAESDGSGQCEGVVISPCGGSTAVCIGAIDRRNSKIYGALKPGDTVLCATGPKAVSQFMCKAEKRQAVAATKDSQDKQILLVLDGKNDRITITGFGHAIDVSRKDGIALVDSTGKAGIQIKDGTVSVFGNVVLGGRTPDPTVKIMMGPPIGSPGGAASPPMLPAMGVSIGK